MGENGRKGGAMEGEGRESRARNVELTAENVIMQFLNVESCILRMIRVAGEGKG